MPPALRALQSRIARRAQGRRFASHGAPQYNEPSGWLFGEKVSSISADVGDIGDRCSSSQPPPPGQKRQKEDWENVWVVGMFGTMALATVLLYYKPDTRFVNS